MTLSNSLKPGILAAGLLLASCQNERAPPAPTVKANGETLLGAYGVRHPGVASFKGIPFAAAPVGELRWQAPEPHRPRAGTQPALEFAAACYQDSYNMDWYRRVGAAFGADAAVFVDPRFSEDCLYLNVWTPSLSARARLPVMVWIHGGANKAGWSFEPNYQGASLAARGNVVVVSIAYRVGIFGFFGHPELRDSAAPANFGLLDQLAALRWVHDNIGEFGGDPANTTVLGESAGAANIGYLMTSPLAQGLFRRAISESGGYQMLDDLDLEDAEKVGSALSTALPDNPDLAALKKRSSAEIFKAAREALRDHDFGPVVDSHVLTQPPAAFCRRQGLPYDLLIGTNEDEWYMYLDGDPAKLADTLQKIPPAVRGLFSARAAQEPDAQHGHDKATTIVNMACPSYLMAASVAGDNHRAWVYRFTRIRPGPGGERLLAYHGAEIPYVFASHDSWFSGDETDAGLTTAMVAYWSNFARTGDPNGAGLVPWPAYATLQPRVQELGSRIAPIAAPDGTLCDQAAGSLYPGWSR
jgi:para-nitrobenzyl esterase